MDAVLYFEGDSSGDMRILRAYKNRFGSIDEICVFSMPERVGRGHQSVGALSESAGQMLPVRASSRRSSVRVRYWLRCRRSLAKPPTGRHAGSRITSISSDWR